MPARVWPRLDDAMPPRHHASAGPSATEVRLALPDHAVLSEGPHNLSRWRIGEGEVLAQ